MQTARQTLLAEAERFYQKLIASGHSSTEELAEASRLLGKVQTSLGNWQNAQDSLDDALGLLQKAAATNTGDADAREMLAVTFNELAKLTQTRWSRDSQSLQKDQRRQLLAEWSRYAEGCATERLAALELQPDSSERMRNYANALMNLSLVCGELARHDRDLDKLEIAEGHISEAQTLRTDGSKTTADSSLFAQDLALGYAAEADLVVTKAELSEKT